MKFRISINASERYNKQVILEKVDTAGAVSQVDAMAGDIDIVTSVSNLISRNDLTLKDIYEFKSFPGPGSFTGLKIGATIANVLNWAVNSKSLSSLEYPDYGREPNITPRKEI
jgi:tRNA A37 threonylcarbamoyladenosine modification protein TsaB